MGVVGLLGRRAPSWAVTMTMKSRGRGWGGDSPVTRARPSGHGQPCSQDSCTRMGRLLTEAATSL